MDKHHWKSFSAIFLALALTSTAHEVRAQAPTLVPCLTGGADPATMQAAFEAAGWTLQQDSAARTSAAETLGEAQFLAIYIPPTPPDLVALDANIQKARAVGRDYFLYPAVALFRQGDAVVAAYFPTAPDMTNLRCQFSAPLLPEVASAVAAGGPTALRSDLYYSEIPLGILPFGVARAQINTLRHVPPFVPTQALLGADALFVSVTFAPSND